MSFPRYPEYKDSGVEWLGAVPAHWQLMRFKWQIDCNDSGVWGDDPDGENDVIVLRSTEQTVDGNWRLDDPASRKLTEAEKRSSLLQEGDLLVTKSSGSASHIGKSTLVTRDVAALECCYSNFMQRIRTKATFSPLLAWYVMNNQIARVQFDLASNSTTGLANLNGAMIGELVFTIPSSDEQFALTAFLDHETAKIDALVAEQETLIALLKEKRQTVISHAVTKGLNPDAPMKDSGIEWLGEVPAHWDVTRLKHATVVIVDCPHETPEYSDDGDYFVIRTADLDEGQIDEVKMYRVGESEYLNRIRREPLRRGDIVYGREGERWGHAAVVPRDDRFCLGQRMTQFRVGGEFCSEFMMWQLNAECTYRQGQVDTVGATSPHVNVGTIRNYYLTQPPLEEQRSIGIFLKATTSAFDELVQQGNQAILLLKERRSALISAAVTGKIDVRGFVADRMAA